MTGRRTGVAMSPPRSTVSPAMRTTRRRWLVALAVALLVQLVTVYSPGAPHGPEVSGLDKVVHLVIFAAPALAGLAAGVPARWLLTLLAIHAPVSELVQWAALPHRDGDVRDAAADLAGVLVGWLVFRGWRRSRRW